MRYLSNVALILTLFVSAASASPADYYRLQGVKRVDQDLYSAQSSMTTVYIQTEYCYHHTFGEDATLKYDQYSFDNKIIWRDGSTCSVKKVWVK
ncbi:MAG: hypothetical protein HY650_02400 [Acidobacteria bacterium]|nr:hypothetical protein [Acidobacteriota bacterium]